MAKPDPAAATRRGWLPAMAFSKEEKQRRRAVAAGPYPRPRGRAPCGLNGARKTWDKLQGKWRDDVLPMSTWAGTLSFPDVPPAPPIAAVQGIILQPWIPAAPQSDNVQRCERTSPSHPGRMRVRLTARTSTPRQRPVTSSYLREPTPEAFRDTTSREERWRAWLDGGHRFEPLRNNRNAEAERRAKRKLQPA